MFHFNPKSRTQIKDVSEESTEKNWDTRQLEEIVYCESSGFASIWFNQAFE
jgi:hypothetical protein